MSIHDSTLVHTANTLLTFLQNESVPFEQAAPTLQLSDTQLTNLQQVVRKVSDADTLPKCFLGGAGQLRQKTNIETADANAALALLKAKGRVLQIGKGRGKGFIVLNTSPLADDALQTMLVGVPQTTKKPKKTSSLEARLADLEIQFHALQAKVESETTV